jgi:hypothetical protein
MKKEVKKHEVKRWEIYTIIGIVAAVVALGIFGSAYYVLNVAGEQTATTPTDTVARTTEEKDLTEIKTDLDKDTALEMTDIDNDLKELELIDFSGV